MGILRIRYFLRPVLRNHRKNNHADMGFNRTGSFRGHYTLDIQDALPVDVCGKKIFGLLKGQFRHLSPRPDSQIQQTNFHYDLCDRSHIGRVSHFFLLARL